MKWHHRTAVNRELEVRVLYPEIRRKECLINKKEVLEVLERYEEIKSEIKGTFLIYAKYCGI